MVTYKPVERPSPNDFFRLAATTPVKIIVGQQREIFEFPVGLLAHYSPHFRDIFSVKAEDGVAPTLTLANENPENFRLLGKYICDGNASFNAYDQEEFDEATKTRQKVLKVHGIMDAFDLVQFANRYQVIQLAAIITPFLKSLLHGPSYDFGLILKTISKEDLDSIIQSLPHQHPVLERIAISCLQILDLEAGWKKVPTKLITSIEDLVTRNHNLAAEMMLLALKGSRNSVFREGDTPEQHWFQVTFELPKEYADTCECLIGNSDECEETKKV